MKSELSEAVKELIQKARIVSFSGWETTHPRAIIPLFQAADDQGRYLTDEDLQQIQTISPQTSGFIPVARLLRDRVTEIVNEAREQVLIRALVIAGVAALWVKLLRVLGMRVGVRGVVHIVVVEGRQEGTSLHAVVRIIVHILIHDVCF